MRVVLAPDKFAGTLGAAEAAAAMAQGWRSIRPDDELVVRPMADGGEGTLAVVAAAVEGAELRTALVADARGFAVEARWLLLPNGTGIVEAAQACGLSRTDVAQRDPLMATSYGVGQLVRAAIDAGSTAVIVGLGGTATVDGGAGAATALGARLRRADGNAIKVGGRYLAEAVRASAPPPPEVPVIAATDVAAPLLGPTGSVACFAPQKGARPEDLPLLEEALTNLADVVERDLPGGPWRDLPGAGAAGGLAFGLAAFACATLRPGAPLIADMIGLSEAVAEAAVVIIGEGSLDDQTLTGKAPAEVARRARAAGVHVLAVAGQVKGEGASVVDQVAVLGPAGLREPAGAVAAATADLARRADPNGR